MALRIKLFADGADLDTIGRLAQDERIKGFTTNPSLMRKAGVTDYPRFAKAAAALVAPRPISFEVLADEFHDGMYEEAMTIAGWAENVYVKIPIVNTRGESAYGIIQALAQRGVQVNVTAVFSRQQIDLAAAALDNYAPACLSVFAGRIADTGVNPIPIVSYAIGRAGKSVEVIWASPRELYNVYQADAIGCHIITVFPAILGKLELEGKRLEEFSRETVQMFADDTRKAGYAVID